MERLHRQLSGQGLIMLAVNQKERANQVAAFMKQYSLSFPALLDSDGKISAAYRVWGLPTTYLIDVNGRTVGMKSGGSDWSGRAATNVLKALLPESGPSNLAEAPLLAAPVEPLPPRVRVRAQIADLHTQQDAQSEVVTRLGRDEELIPIAKALSANDAWYMVRTKTGASGWVRSNDIEDSRSR
jgi:hypothetical protein